MIKFYTIVHNIPFEERVSKNFDLAPLFLFYGKKRETFVIFSKLIF